MTNIAIDLWATHRKLVELRDQTPVSNLLEYAPIAHAVAESYRLAMLATKESMN